MLKRSSLLIGLAAGLLVLGLPVAALPVAATAEAQDVSCGSVITEDTTLHSDVGPCENSDGLIVKGSNITLNLNGHSVVGALRVFGAEHWQKAATGQFAGIRLEGVAGTTVANGTIEQFAAGVALFNSSGNTLTGLNVHDNIGPRGTDFLGDGIALFRSSGNILVRNVVRHNGPFSGVAFVGPSTDNRVRNSEMVDNNLPDLDSSDEAVHSQDFGVRIEGPAASRNVVNNSVISGNGTAGVHISPSCTPHPTCETTPGPNADNVISGNEVRRNGFGPLGDGSFVPSGAGDGILVYTTPVGRRHLGAGYAPGTGTLIERNNVRGNARHGIIMFPDANGNTIRNNTAVGNGALGRGFDGIDRNFAGSSRLPPDTPDCGTNIWLNNRFGTVNQPCVNGQTGQRPPQAPTEAPEEQTTYTHRGAGEGRPPA